MSKNQTNFVVGDFVKVMGDFVKVMGASATTAMPIVGIVSKVLPNGTYVKNYMAASVTNPHPVESRVKKADLELISGDEWKQAMVEFADYSYDQCEQRLQFMDNAMDLFLPQDVLDTIGWEYPSDEVGDETAEGSDTKFPAGWDKIEAGDEIIEASEVIEATPAQATLDLDLGKEIIAKTLEAKAVEVHEVKPLVDTAYAANQQLIKFVKASLTCSLVDYVLHHKGTIDKKLHVALAKTCNGMIEAAFPKGETNSREVIVSWLEAAVELIDNKIMAVLRMLNTAHHDARNTLHAAQTLSLWLDVKMGLETDDFRIDLLAYKKRFEVCIFSQTGDSVSTFSFSERNHATIQGAIAEMQDFRKARPNCTVFSVRTVG